MSDTKEDANFALPSSPNDRKKIKDALHEISAQYQMMDDRKSCVKDIVDALHEEFKIPKKIITKLAKTLYKHNYGDVSHESSLFELVYEGIVQTVQPTTDNQNV